MKSAAPDLRQCGKPPVATRRRFLPEPSGEHRLLTSHQGRNFKQGGTMLVHEDEKLGLSCGNLLLQLQPTAQQVAFK